GDPAAIASLSGPALTASGFPLDVSEFLVSWVETDTLGARNLYLRKVYLDLFSDPLELFVDSAFGGVIRSRPGLLAQKPAVSGNEEGWVTLAWTEQEAGVANVFGLSLDLGEETLPPTVRLTEPEEGFGTPAGRCAVSVKRDGGFSLAWEDRSGTDSDIRLQNYTADGSIDFPYYISPVPGSTETGNVAFRGLNDGRFVMYLEAGTGNSARIKAAEYDRRGRPLSGDPKDAAPGGARAQTHQVTVAGPGRWNLLAWEEKDSLYYSLNAIIFSPAGEVSRQNFSFESSTQNHLGTLAADVDASGQFYLAWERWQPNKPAPDLMLAVMDSQGKVLGDTLVASSSAGGGRMAAVAVTDSGNCIIVWRQGAAGEDNAYFAGRIYGHDRSVVRDGLQVSERKLSYLGTSGRPAAAASDSSGNFLVIWQEFFNQQNQIYYRMYTAAGDSLDLREDLELSDSLNPEGIFRKPLIRSSSSVNLVQHSPTVTTDSTGGFLVFWVETEPGVRDELYGIKLDSGGRSQGSAFRVPGIEMASLPVVHIIGPDLVVVAWEDTVGENSRVLAIQLDLH
ncbi:MAG TPA: hypothetical protein VJ417_10750, partial [Candidatus Glassbacteria bacterium]|nr:hypothetical protein [Candidatus Glassbacteria bacterium]